MEMCYEGAFLMPSNYAIMDEEEMTYVEGGGTKSFSSRKAAAAEYATVGTRIQVASVLGGAGIAVLCTLIGGSAGIPGAVIGAILGVAGGAVIGSIAWGIGTKFHDCSRELSQMPNQSKACKVTWTNMGADFYYKIS